MARFMSPTANKAPIIANISGTRVTCPNSSVKSFSCPRAIILRKWNGSAGPEVDRTGVTLSVRLKVKIYGIWMVGYIGITVTSLRKPWACYNIPGTHKTRLVAAAEKICNDGVGILNLQEIDKVPSHNRFSHTQSPVYPCNPPLSILM